MATLKWPVIDKHVLDFKTENDVIEILSVVDNDVDELEWILLVNPVFR